MTHNNERPPIPEPLKRAVRQRCGFACVVCGCPIGLEYDHIVEWSIVRTHELANLTLLCGHCHGEKTAGRMTAEKVRRCNEDPAAMRSGKTGTKSMHCDELCEIAFGNNIAVIRDNQTVAALVIDDHVLLALRRQANYLMLNLELRDRADEPIFTIVDNELTQRTDVWDSRWEGNTYLLRSRLHKVVLRMKLELPHRVTIEAGRFYAAGVEVLVKPSGAVCLPSTGDISEGWRSTDVDTMFGLGRCSASKVSVSRPTIPRREFTDKEIQEWLDSERVSE